MKNKMKNKLFIFHSLVMIMGGMMAACHSTDKLQVYQFTPSVDCDSYGYLEWAELIELGCLPTTIILKNDSILNYFKRFGGLGYLTTIKYHLKDNLTTIDSLDVYGRMVPEEIINAKMIYSTDSLVNKKTNERYYNQKYLDETDKRLKREGKNSMYLVLHGRKYKASASAFKRIYRRIDPLEYNWIELDKTEAKKLYRINEKYKTYEFQKKE